MGLLTGHRKRPRCHLWVCWIGSRQLQCHQRTHRRQREPPRLKDDQEPQRLSATCDPMWDLGLGGEAAAEAVPGDDWGGWNVGSVLGNVAASAVMPSETRQALSGRAAARVLACQAPAVSQPCPRTAPVPPYVPCAGRVPGTDVDPRLQIGDACTAILPLFMNILILKQQIPESADL